MSFGYRHWVIASSICYLFTGFASAQNQRTSAYQPSHPQQSRQPESLTPTSQPDGLPAGAVARLGQTRLRHADKVTCVAFAPDGKTLLTGGEDGMLRVWSVATGDQIGMLQKAGQSVTGIRYTRGGKYLAMTFNDNTLRLFDPGTLKQVGSVSFINRHHFAFSRDGAFLATSDFVGNAVVTEVANDLPKLELTNANVFDFRPDGKAIAVGDAQGNVKIHVLTGGKPIFAVKQEGAIRGITYSPDGHRMAVGSHVKEGVDVICVYEEGKSKPVAEIAGASYPQTWIGSDSLACGNDVEAGVYDLAKKQWASRVNGIAGEFAISLDGTKLAASGSGTRVRLWDLTSGKQLHAENDSFPEPALLAGSSDGRTLFLLSANSAYLWHIDTARAKSVGTLPGRAIAAAVNGNTLIVATPEAVVLYAGFDPAQPLPAKPTHVLKDSAGARTVAISPTGNRVAWSAGGGKITVADIGDKNRRRELAVATTAVFALGFSTTGDRLGVLGRDPYMRVWDVSSDRDEAKEMWKARIQRGQNGAVVFSPDGKYVTAVSTAQLLVFDARDGKDEGEIRPPLFRCERYSDQGQIQHAGFSADSRLLDVGSVGMYGRIEVCELATHDLVRPLTTGYGGSSRLCVFPNGKLAASAGAEETVTVWDLTFRANKATPQADELRKALDDLASSEASLGYPAVWVFVSAGNRGVDLLSKTVKETSTQEKKIRGWIEDLGSNTFRTRENAAKELVALGIRAIPALNAAIKSEDTELSDRAREVMEKITAKGAQLSPSGMTGDSLRLFRAVKALEEIGTPEARTVLKSIVDLGGKPGEEAKSALTRMKK